MSFSIDELKKQVRENLYKDLIPIINVEELIQFYSQSLDLPIDETVSFLEGEIKDIVIRGVSITNRFDTSSLDNGKTFEFFTSFNEFTGFSFNLIDEIALESEVPYHSIYIALDDLKQCQVLYSTLPKEKCKYARIKNPISIFRENNYNDQHTPTPPYTQLNRTQAENLELKAQIEELQKKITELEKEQQKKEIQNLSKPDIESSKYNPTERETHLQAIAILALRYAEQNESRLMTDTGKIKKSSIAKILKDESTELFTTPKSAETFRPRIAEAIKFYSQEVE
ncbi:hypothetical protein ACPWUF_07875 [Bisgaard Taxon 46]